MPVNTDVTLPGQFCHSGSGGAGRAEKGVQLAVFQCGGGVRKGEVAGLYQFRRQAAAEQDLLRVAHHAGVLLAQRHPLAVKVADRIDVGVRRDHQLAFLHEESRHGAVSVQRLAGKRTVAVGGIQQRVALGNAQLEEVFTQQTQIGGTARRCLHVHTQFIGLSSKSWPSALA